MPLLPTVPTESGLDLGAGVDLALKVGGLAAVVLAPFGRSLVVRAIKASKNEVKALIDDWYAETIGANAQSRALAAQTARDMSLVREAVQFQGNVLHQVGETLGAMKTATERLTEVVDRMDERDREKSESLAALVGKFETLERHRLATRSTD